MRPIIQLLILLFSVALTFVYAYNQGVKDGLGYYSFFDATKSYVALRLLDEKGKEKTVSYLESELDLNISIQRNIEEERSIYHRYLNHTQLPDFGYYQAILEYREKHPTKDDNSIKDDLTWLIAQSNANKSLKQDK